MDLCVVWGVMRKRYWEQFYKTPRKQLLFSPIRHPISLKQSTGRSKTKMAKAWHMGYVILIDSDIS